MQDQRCFLNQRRRSPFFDLIQTERLIAGIRTTLRTLPRLATAIATGGSLSTLLSAVHDREGRRSRLHGEQAALDGVSFAQFDANRVEQELRTYLTEWPSLAQQHHAQTNRSFGHYFRVVFASGGRSWEAKSAIALRERRQLASFSIG